MSVFHATVKKRFIKQLISQIDISGVKGPLLLSLLNQVVSSGGNFVVGVYLARTLTLADFGLYGISYSICMLYIGFGNAVLLTQMVVNMPDKAEASKEGYASRILLGVLILSTLTLVLVALISLAVMQVWPGWQLFSSIIATIALTSVALLAKEFLISYAYVRRNESLALLVSIISVGILCGGLAIEYLAGIELSAQNVLLLYASGAIAGTLVGYWLSPLSIAVNARNLMPDFIEAWRHGRWALGGVSATWIQAQAYTYILAFFLGPAGVGQANAARIFISPFNFLIPAINQIAIPRLADLRESDRARMLRVSVMLTVGLLFVALVYSAILLTSMDFVFTTVLGRHDAGVQALIPIWCIFLVIQLAKTGGSVLLQVMRRFRILALINIPSAITAIVTAIILIQQLGASGAIWGTVAAEIVLTILIWREIRNVRNHRN
ncbi:MAG: lipopolysaccharide biosynthesis protein [Burkholderiaceae bacterium]